MPGPRDDLLARVVEYYAEHGVGDTSLRTLAAAIGTSQRMLHYHFGSREEVLAAVIDAVAGSQAAQIAALFEAPGDPFEAGRRNWHATVAGAQRYGALWFELATHAMRGEPHARALGEVMVAAQIRAFTAVYAERADATTAAELARLTVAVGQGLIFDLLIDGDRAAADAAVERFTVMVHAALNATAGPSHDPVG